MRKYIAIFKWVSEYYKESLMKNEILLNHIFLKNRVAELGIKQWWLAEQVGVDRKTVIRWIQGQVKSIQSENAERLAKILECGVDELTLKNAAEKLATAEDQKIAASVLMNSSFIEKLGPIGEWNVIESLLKATIVPNLPLNVLGEVYDKLTIASWRQSKIDQAAQYNAKTEEIARKTDDKTLLASALLSKANIYSWRGEISKAVETYRRCLDLEKYINPKTLGAIYSNLGGVLYESGDLVEGEKWVRKSIEIFDLGGKPINLSISHCHLALIYLQINQIEKAAHATQLSIHYANLDDFRRGKTEGKLLQAEIEAHRGNRQAAEALVDQGLEEFGKLGIFEGLNFEQAGRTHRLLGNIEKAEAFFLRGLEVSQAFPVYHAALYAELALVLQRQGHPDWTEKLQKAMDIYRQVECPLRIEMLKKQFQIK